VENLAEKLVSALEAKGWSVATAESCTGGWVSGAIVSVPGSSSVINASIVTYSNESKAKFVGVSQENLKNFGAVSQQVAEQMASGVAKLFDANIGISVTGIAGPGGATPQKPLGTVWFGFYINGTTHTFHKLFENATRNEVRNKSVQFALSKTLELIS